MYRLVSQQNVTITDTLVKSSFVVHYAVIDLVTVHRRHVCVFDNANENISEIVCRRTKEKFILTRAKTL